MKGDWIKESLNVSDLIIFISTFVYRKSIRRFSAFVLRLRSFGYYCCFVAGILAFSQPLLNLASSILFQTPRSLANGITCVFDVMVIQNGILNWQIVYLLFLRFTPPAFQMTFFSSVCFIFPLFCFCFGFYLSLFPSTDTFITFWWFVFVIISEHQIDLLRC